MTFFGSMSFQSPTTTEKLYYNIDFIILYLKNLSHLSVLNFPVHLFSFFFFLPKQLYFASLLIAVQNSLLATFFIHQLYTFKHWITNNFLGSDTRIYFEFKRAINFLLPNESTLISSKRLFFFSNKAKECH